MTSNRMDILQSLRLLLVDNVSRISFGLLIPEASFINQPVAPFRRGVAWKAFFSTACILRIDNNKQVFGLISRGVFYYE